MYQVIKLWWESNQRKKLHDRQIKEAQLEKLKKSFRPAFKENVIPNIQSCEPEEPVAYGRRPDTHYSTHGTITELNINDETGIIDHRLPFNKVVAGTFFIQLNVGVKVRYAAYCDNKMVECVKTIEDVLDDAWETQAEDIVEDAPCVNFSIEQCTVLGRVIEKQGCVYTVTNDSNQDREIIFDLDDIKNDGFIPEIGDFLKMEAKHKVDGSFVNSCGTIVEVISIEPARKQRHSSRVFSVHNDHAVFSDSIGLTYLIFKTISKKLFLKCDDIVEFERIECDHEFNSNQFNWRAIKVFGSKEQNASTEQHESTDEDDNKDIIFMKEVFKIEQHSVRFDHKLVQILNNSDNVYTIKSCSVDCDDRFCQINNTLKPPFTLRVGGSYKVHFRIYPKEEGTTIVNLTVDFGSFQKRTALTIVVNKKQGYNNPNDINFSQKGRIIPGQKVKQSSRFMDIRFKEYAIPLNIRDIDFTQATRAVIDDLRIYNSQLFQELTPNTYRTRMRHCLYIEEIAMEIAFDGYKIERAHFENTMFEKDEYLKLEVKDVNEKRPSIALGDSILASSPFKYNNSKPVIYEGNIHKLLTDAILVKFHSDFIRNHKNVDYKIDFKFSRAGYRRQQHALDVVLDKNGLGLEFLFPIMIDSKPQHELPQVDLEINDRGFLKHRGFDREMEWFNKRLNEYQKAAVVNILRGECRPLPYIIFGPPGTGKTMTLVETILQISTLVEDSRIIVATPSNSAADLIAHHLIASGKFKTGDFIRFVSYIQFEKDRIPEEMKKHCATINTSSDNGNLNSSMIINESGLKLNVPKSFIGKHKLYISTLTALGPLMNLRFPANQFTHVIIDEAGQAIETETMIPFSFLNKHNAQVIMAGDPKQLGPVVTSKVSKEFQFHRSFLERLSHHQFYLKSFGSERNEYDCRFLTKLRKNYRSLPSIMKMYNDLYYDGELEAIVKNESSKESLVLSCLDGILWNRDTANKKCGVYFCNVNGMNARTSESPSWFNEAEAGKIGVFLSNLLNSKVHPNDIGIITPYAQQVKIIRNLLIKFGEAGESGVKVGTVEEFQGQEKSIILVSTVRTCSKLISSDTKFGLGFLQCPKRMNVAISRARSLLVVFGKENVLIADSNWKHLIEYTKENNTFVS